MEVQEHVNGSNRFWQPILQTAIEIMGCVLRACLTESARQTRLLASEESAGGVGGRKHRPSLGLRLLFSVAQQRSPSQTTPAHVPHSHEQQYHSPTNALQTMQ